MEVRKNMNTTEIIKEKVNKRISRRSFLKWSAAIGATSSISGLVINSATKMAGAEATTSTAPVTAGTLTWKPFVCLRCHSWCSHAAGIDSDGIIRKVEGLGGQPCTGAQTAADGTTEALAIDWANVNAANWEKDPNYIEAPKDYLPYDIHNHGRICSKGTDHMEQVYNPDRVKYPLKRVGDRGSGQWARISWAAAYTEIATAIKEVIDIHPNNFVYWQGRNQTDIDGRFAAAIGTKNTLNHTSICESSRHAAHTAVWSNAFSLPDLQDHTVASDNVDYLINFGGNPCEAGLPHAPYARMWSLAKGRGCRFVTVDVRQSNSAAFSDESITIKPGSDGALALGIAWVIFTKNGTVATVNFDKGGGYTSDGSALGWEFLHGHANEAKVFGMYRHEETTQGGYANPYDGATTWGAPYAAVPDGASFQSYVLGLGADGVVKDTAWAESQTGIPAAKIVELAKDLSKGRNIVDSLTNYNHPVIEGYRGPAKHVDGTQQWRIIRSLTVLTGNFDVKGGVMSVGNGASKKGGAPADAATARTYDSTQTYMRWDATTGVAAWPMSDWGVDQNLSPVLRVACGIDSGTPPSYAYTTASHTGTNIPADLKATPKALMLFKNAPTYSRPEVNVDKELFTEKWEDGSYKLKYLWAIDTVVGDGSRYADIILPDGTHPERYDYVGGELFARCAYIKLRQPVVGPLYEARQVRAILYELCNTAPLAAATPYGGGAGTVRDWFSYDPAASTENWQTSGGNAVANVRSDGTPDGDAATVAWMKKETAGVAIIPGANTAEKWAYITKNGIAGGGNADTKTYAASSYTKAGWKTGSKVEIYNAVLATKSWRSGDVTFNGTPALDIVSGVYTGNGGYPSSFYSKTGWFGDPATYTHALTTYKLNVHDQANTAESPRLMEIIGNNWAVIGQDGSDSTGLYALASDGTTKIRNGDTVKVTSPVGEGEWEAKITPKAQAKCVHISHHLGHDGSPLVVSNGSYEVDSASNRADADSATFGNLVTKGAVNTSLDATSPGRGHNVNYLIARKSDPIGASQSFYDTRVKVEKV
jgi:anaerobic selenocysteine-containing dehydrogenase